MKVIFLQNVKDVANRGDVKDVAPGHAQNFLFPKGLACPATKDTIGEFEAEKKKRARAAEADLHRTEALVQKLDGYELELAVKVSPTGTLYAALTPARIIDELKRNGFEVAHADIQLPDGAPLKETGEYDATVNLDHGLEAEIKIILEASS